MEENILKILKAAILAPSGENCQPWKVKVLGNALDLFNDPTKDTSLYNDDQKGSMVAHGAFIENLIIASKSLGLNPQINFFPDPSNQDWIASITFLTTPIVKDPLYEVLQRRVTNRKPFKNIPLTPDQKNKILLAGGDNVLLCEDKDKIREMSHPISLNEQLIFENFYLHQFFYNHIRWNKEEDEKYKDGFFIKTLELKPPQKIALKILKSWKWAERAKKIGMSRQIAKDNANNYATAAALGIVVIPGNTRKDYVDAGRIMERVWLEVTSMNLSLQPMTGVLFFMQRLLSGDVKEFSKNEVERIRNAYDQIKNGFGVKDKTIAMLFRVGQSDEPTARSSRFDVSSLLSQ